MGAWDWDIDIWNWGTASSSPKKEKTSSKPSSVTVKLPPPKPVLPPEEEARLLKQHQPSASQNRRRRNYVNPGVTEYAEEMGKSGVRGVTEGVTGIVDIMTNPIFRAIVGRDPTALQEIFQNPERALEFPVTETAQKTLDPVLGPDEEVADKNLRLAKRGARLAGDLAVPIGAVSKGRVIPHIAETVAGAATGVGAGEAAADWLGEEWRPYAELIGTVPGVAGAAVVDNIARKYLNPVEGRITSRPGKRTAPMKGASTNHAGTDFAVPVGTVVKAPLSGTVSKVGRGSKSRGNWVEVEMDDGTTHRFLHLDGFNVKPGDKIKQGQPFARSGNTGRSTGPHLHWSVFRDGKPVDPSSESGVHIAKDGLPGNQDGVRPMDPQEIARIMDDMEAAGETPGPKYDPEDDVAPLRIEEDTPILGDEVPSPQKMAEANNQLEPGFDLETPNIRPDEIRVFHGTTGDYKGLPRVTDYSGKLGRAIYTSTSPETASLYASAPNHITPGANVRPLAIQRDKVFGLNRLSGWRKEELLAAADELGFGGKGFESDIDPFFAKKDVISSEMAIKLFQNRVGTERFTELLSQKGYHALAGKMGNEVEIGVFKPENIREYAYEGPDRDPNPPAASRTFGTGRQGPNREPPRRSEEGHPEGEAPRTERPMDPRYEGLEPEEKLHQALKDAKPLSARQKNVLHNERAERARKLAQVQARGGSIGEQKAVLKGETPNVEYESILHNFTPEDVDALANKINFNNWLQPYEKVNALTALMKLLGAEGIRVPTAREIKLLAHVFPENLIEAMLGQRTFMQKFWDNVGQAANFPRAIMSSFDISAPFRQGLFMIGRKEWWGAWKDMFKALGSQRAYDAMMDEIHTRPTADLMRRANLAITDMGSFMSNREEAFMSKWADKIPGIKQSNRAYTGFLVKLRADVFDSLIEAGRQQGKAWETDAKALKDLGSFVNASTGRGSLGIFEQSAPFLNAMFFSPRLISSRVTLLNPFYYPTLDPFVRKEAMKNLLVMSGTASTILGLAAFGGAEVETDWRSSDFAKIKVGNTRYDILGGFQQYMVLGSRIITGVTKTARGELKSLTDKKYGAENRLTLIGRFLRNKLSPTVSYFANSMAGTDPTGEDFHPVNDAYKSFVPMATNDIIEIVAEEGFDGFAKGSPAYVGVGVQHYQPRPKKTKSNSDPWASGDWSGTESPTYEEWNF